MREGTLMVELIYELLDASADTIELSHDREPEPHWAAHLDYLRALERKGHELLAQTCPEPLA